MAASAYPTIAFSQVQVWVYCRWYIIFKQDVALTFIAPLTRNCSDTYNNQLKKTNSRSSVSDKTECTFSSTHWTFDLCCETCKKQINIILQKCRHRQVFPVSQSQDFGFYKISTNAYISYMTLLMRNLLGNDQESAKGKSVQKSK